MILVIVMTSGAFGSAVTADQQLSRNVVSPSESTTVSINLKGGERPCASPIDVVLSIDSSGSMTTSDPEDLRKSAARQFVSGLDLSTDRVGIVSWNTSATTWPLTNNLSDIESSINSIGADGNTCLDTGLKAAIDLLTESSGSKVIVLLTDGISTDGGHYTPPGIPGSPVDEARSKGIMVFTIALGPDADARNLTEIARSTGGEFYTAPDASALADIYQRIRSSITGIVAKDVIVTYVLPSALSVNLSPYSGSQPVASVRKQGDSTVLTWQIGAIQANQSRTLSFDVSSPEPGTFVLGTSPDTAVSYTDCGGTRSAVPIPPLTLRVSPPGSFSLEGSGIGGSNASLVQNISVLSVSKEVLPNGNAPCPNCPRLRITLDAPGRSCNADILFVIDKSGSMRDRDSSGRANFEIMRNALNEMLNAASSTPELRNARIAIVSWDDLNGTDDDDRITTLDPQWLTIGDPRIKATIQQYNELTCKETDLTFYEAGLQKAMRIMHSRIISQANDPLSCDTRRFIIFITCRSEFKGISKSSVLYRIPRNNTLIRGGFEGIFPFYIGTDLNEYPLELQDLSAIAQLGDPLQRGAAAPESLTAGNLLSTVLARMSGCAQGPWVTNVTLTETLYPYLKYTGADPLPSAVTYNRDGSTTLRWDIGTLNTGERWSTTIDTSVQLKLPVDVTERRSGFGGNISSSTPYSRVDFDWPALSCAAPLRRHYELPLAEGRMWITCGAPCKTPAVSEQTQTGREAGEAPEAPTGNRTQPGFEVLLGVLSMMAIYLYVRRP
ncbi:MAG: VWA domain-containing protein [Methanothrix sp.]|nr:VWA domain-containing protein [Methanothrix sp.]MCX8207107.1 VWA domain-containing protein [Methanothrix sp.]